MAGSAPSRLSGVPYPRRPAIVLRSASRIALTLLSTLPALAGAATFGPTPYASTADSPFVGLAGYTVIDFEGTSFAFPSGITASGGSRLTDGVLRDSVDADSGAIDGSGSGGFSWYSAGNNAVSFTFNAALLGALPKSAGIVWTDVGFRQPTPPEIGGPSPVVFEAYDAADNLLGSVSADLGDGNVAGETAEDRFFGYSSDAGIARITLRMPNSTDWELDHVQYAMAPIPEPSTYALLGAGLALLGFAVRRRTG